VIFQVGLHGHARVDAGGARALAGGAQQGALGGQVLFQVGGGAGEQRKLAVAHQLRHLALGQVQAGKGKQDAGKEHESGHDRRHASLEGGEAEQEAHGASV